MGNNELLLQIAQDARAASRKLAFLKPAIKNNALLKMADALEQHKDTIQAANKIDVEAAEKKELSKAMIDRLLLNDKRIKSMADSIRKVAELDDPVGEIYDMKTRPNGLRVGRMRVPIGVIGIIYEARPNVTSDAACLCIKSGNAVILRGGSESINSNIKIADIMNSAGENAGLPDNSIQLLPKTDRELVTRLLKLNEYIDLIIPRGGKSLIETVVQNSTIPVIKHYDGNCYIYVDDESDISMAEKIIINAKTQRPGVCNAVESLLINANIAQVFLPTLISKLREKGVEVRGCEATKEIVPDVIPAVEEDWKTEYLDLIISIKVIDAVEDAINFINTYSSHHTDSIITTNYEKAIQFLNEVDSACVFVNASTRFSDGGEFGMGCEIGISTDKLHARGPMGLKELTTSKFIVFGNGQIRE